MKRGPKPIKKQVRLRAIPLLIDAQFSREEIACLLQITVANLGYFLSRNDMTNGHAGVDEQRANEMEAMYRGGKTLEETGVHFGVSRERVRQILSARGINRSMGGAQHADKKALSDGRRLARWQGSRSKKNASCNKHYGCDYETLIAANDGKNISVLRGKAHIYVMQRKNAIRRRIEWKLTFPEWCAIWAESGKWEQRGRGKDGYCMGRNSDAGPYALGNVHITTISANASDSYIYKPVGMRHVKWKRDGDGLTAREREVWTLSTQGYGPSKIGALLGIRSATVAQHILHARAALEMKTAA